MSWLVAVSVVAAAGFSYWQYWRWTHRRMLELAAKVPGPPALPVLGNALMFMFNPGEILNKIEALYKSYGEYFKFWLGPDLNICVQNPTDIRALLTSNKVNQKGPLYEILVPFIGYGILAGGPTWRNHRKIATPAYNKKSVEHFTPVFNAEAEHLASVLRHKDPNTTFDVYKDIVKCTTQSVNQTLLGLSKEDSQNLYRMEEVVAKTRDMYELIFAKMTRWWLQIPIIYWLAGKKRLHNYYVKLIDDFSTDVVRRRRKALEESTPDEEAMGIVDRFILSGEMSEKEVKWDTFTLFTTSQEAAAKMASGVLMILAHLPEWQDKVYNEMMEVVGGHGPVSSEQLKQMQYLDMVYKETLRYFAIAALIQRTVEEEITINEGKITLPAGTSLVLPIHCLHRDPRYWEDPYKVMPERFLPENVKKRDPNAFVPFSLGPMDCLGRVYATALIKTIVVWVLRYTHLEPAGSLDNIKLNVAISVSAADGYNVRDKVYNEMMEVVGGHGPVSSEQLKQMQYLDMVYKETLRYFAIAALIQRTVEEEITINEGKITLPAGTSLVLPIHCLHRDPRYWEDPYKVMPERFLPENVKKRDPNAFVPFSLGPMDCLGRVYATALIKTIVVWVLRYTHLEPAGSLDNIKLNVAISVSAADGYNVRVRPRNSANGKISNNGKINGFK